ncbi:hypothetical protein ABH931_000051 [Streptacidiphilus sp. MAP12-33]
MDERSGTGAPDRGRRSGEAGDGLDAVGSLGNRGDGDAQTGRGRLRGEAVAAGVDGDPLRRGRLGEGRLRQTGRKPP